MQDQWKFEYAIMMAVTEAEAVAGVVAEPEPGRRSVGVTAVVAGSACTCFRRSPGGLREERKVEPAPPDDLMWGRRRGRSVRAVGGRTPTGRNSGRRKASNRSEEVELADLGSGHEGAPLGGREDERGPVRVL